MRIGLQLCARGHEGSHSAPAPRWTQIRQQVDAAESAGFDLCCISDGLLDGDMGEVDFWESTTMASAVAATSTRIGIAHSVLNPPLRSPALIAKTAVTIDEVSGGRYTLGIGAGNTPLDYDVLGIPTDHRYSRAAETIEIVHQALRHGAVDFNGTYHQVKGTFEPRGPRPEGPPIVVGASRPKMIRLAVRFADGWNGWSPNPQTVEAFRPATDEVNRACEEMGRDPSTLSRSLDLAVDTRELMGDEPGGITPYLVHGGAQQMAEQLLAFGELGIDEVRCILWPDPPLDRRPAIIQAMAEVVSLVHAN